MDCLEIATKPLGYECGELKTATELVIVTVGDGEKVGDGDGRDLGWRWQENQRHRWREILRRGCKNLETVLVRGLETGDGERFGDGDGKRFETALARELELVVGRCSETGWRGI